MESKIAMGTRLKSERERLKLSQVEFGRSCGVTQNTQYLYEQGKGAPDGEYFAKAAGLGVDVAYILIGAGVVNTKISARELALVDRFRLSDVPVQDGVLALLESTAKLGQSPPQNSTVIKQKSKGKDAIQIGSANGATVTIKK
jgi:transcriptional regulator with XRE-family HTH domain